MTLKADDFTFSESLSQQQVLEWLKKRIGSIPTTKELLEFGKTLYKASKYKKAAIILSLYIDRSDCEVIGEELLGYALIHCGDKMEALQIFRRVVQDPKFEADWQIVVELQIELEGQGL
ncbi:hypothetical protein ADUPG1_008494 [Aduncisulcus paluster]|uniref:Tetratricopeptide repeat protein n=1 Tax=Aduncisulcus paluster TaxID=2918883 RepID=A0ABQ5KS77_9EUKA|nr:hypothetical protein ADUPG1_008494 [Aduncisulcus paluster]